MPGTRVYLPAGLVYHPLQAGAGYHLLINENDCKMQVIMQDLNLGNFRCTIIYMFFFFYIRNERGVKYIISNCLKKDVTLFKSK